MDGKRPIDTMQESLNSLVKLTKSGYWSFSSPAPCSTEVKIKKAVNAAIANLELAITYHESMFGKKEMKP